MANYLVFDNVIRILPTKPRGRSPRVRRFYCDRKKEKKPTIKPHLLFEIPVVRAGPRVVLEIGIPVFSRERVFPVQHVAADGPFVLFAGQYVFGREPFHALRERVRFFLVLVKRYETENSRRNNGNEPDNCRLLTKLPVSATGCCCRWPAGAGWLGTAVSRASTTRDRISYEAMSAPNVASLSMWARSISDVALVRRSSDRILFWDRARRRFIRCFSNRRRTASSSSSSSVTAGAGSVFRSTGHSVRLGELWLRRNGRPDDDTSFLYTGCSGHDVRSS